MTYFYFGIHKAATTWLIELLGDICDEIGLVHKHYHSSSLFDRNIEKEISKNSVDFYSYTNSDYTYVNPLSIDYKGFHVIRDPRDIVVSSYFSHMNSHSTEMWPELVEYRKELKSLELADGIYSTIKHLEALSVDGEIIPMFKNLRHWNYQNERILEIRFEDLIKNPYVIVPEIFKFLELLDLRDFHDNHERKNSILKILQGIKDRNHKAPYMITLERLLLKIYHHDFYFKTKGRPKGTDDAKSHYRKGLEGDWKNYFNAKHIAYFKKHYGDLLIDLKYEKDLDW